MTTLAIRPIYAVKSRWVDEGISEEAQFVAGLTRRAFISLRGARQQLPFDELSSIRSQENLDGSILRTAQLFLLALPSWTPPPEVAVDPDGEIAFDWFGSRGKNFSVSIGIDGLLSFAGQFGPRVSMHGKDEFIDSVPHRILEAIAALCEQNSARDQAA